MSLTHNEGEILVRVLLAAFLGGIVGAERQWRRHPAGLRTQMLVALGSCLFTMISIYGFPGSDTSRVAAQIVTGIGFLGAGTLFRTGSTVRGLTTAATIWAVAAVGMAVGTGLYQLAILSTLIIMTILLILRLFEGKSTNEESESSRE